MRAGLLPLLLAAVWVLCAVWQMQENKSLRDMLRSALLRPPQEHKILAQAYARSFLFLLTLACCIAIFGSYEWKLARMRAEQAALTAQEQPVAAAARPSPPPQAAAPIHAAPAPSTSAAPAAPPAAPSPEAELYNLLAPANGVGAKLDMLKQYYEDLVVEYMFLEHCGLSQPGDKTQLIAVMQHDIALSGGAAALTDSIFTAAQGTYTEVYANTSCGTPEAQATAERFHAYLARVKKAGD